MAYDAYVPCRCYERGLTTPPSHPELVRSEEDWLYLELPLELCETDPARYQVLHQAFNDWKATACPHPDMEVVSCWVANMAGMAAFRQLLHVRGGPARYPVLSEQLPTANGGSIPAHLAPALLRELAALAAEPPELRVVLRAQATHELVCWVGAGAGKVFVYVAGPDRRRYALSEQGFSILRRHELPGGDYRHEELFESGAFRQQQLDDQLFRFTDVATGYCYDCSVGLRVGGEPAPAADFEVVRENQPVAEGYAYILEPLQALAEAALATGHPICWT